MDQGDVRPRAACPRSGTRSGFQSAAYRPPAIGKAEAADFSAARSRHRRRLPQHRRGLAETHARCVGEGGTQAAQAEGRVTGVEGNKLTVAFDHSGETKVIDTFVTSG